MWHETADPAAISAALRRVGVALAEDGRRVLGLYDYDSAAWADRHHDFPSLLFDGDRVDLIEAALASYESATGRALSRERILLYNAARAFSYLAFRTGVAPDVSWCGRTLAEDVAWCEWAAENVLAGRGARLLG